jgi:hypothetical protein
MFGAANRVLGIPLKILPPADDVQSAGTYGPRAKSMNCLWRTCLAGLVLILGVTPSDGRVQVDFRPGFDPDPRLRNDLARSAEAHAQKAVTLLRRVSDCRLDPERDLLRVTVGYVPDGDSAIVPACYTFPDSTIRVIPEYIVDSDDAGALDVLRRFVVFEEPTDVILQKCSTDELREIPGIVTHFIQSELIHECYHDWQNRLRRYPALEQGKTILNRDRQNVGADWKGYLQDHGVDMVEHGLQVAESELECCTIQATYWRSLYGPNPTHPLARAISHLISSAAVYYRSQLAPASQQVAGLRER